MNGAPIIARSREATALFTVVSLVAVVSDHPVARGLALGVSLALFAVGLVVFPIAYFTSLGRSRAEFVTVPGVFFLTTAPRRVRLELLGLLGVQIVVAVAAASIRPFSTLAFGILVPMFGVAQCGLWAARHATYEPRFDEPAPPRAAGGARPADVHDAEDN